jgi:threonine/homoserine/homoserine lactone efflux protein
MAATKKIRKRGIVAIGGSVGLYVCFVALAGLASISTASLLAILSLGIFGLCLLVYGVFCIDRPRD